MGNCCAKLFGYQNVYANEDNQQSTLELLKEGNEREVSMAQDEEIQNQDPSLLKDQYTIKEIEELEQQFLQEINNLNLEEFEKIDPNLKGLDIEQAQFYVKFIQQDETGYYDNIIMQEVYFNYSVEQILLFILHFQGSLSKHTDINEDIIEYYDEENKILRRINYYKSKKVLMIQPKYLLDIEILKNKDDDYIIIQRSCKGTKLENNNVVKKKLKDIDIECLMETKVGGYLIEKTEKGCKLTIYKNVNSKSSIGLRMAKGTLKSNFNYYLKTVDEELKKFVEQDHSDLKKYMIQTK